MKSINLFSLITLITISLLSCTKDYSPNNIESPLLYEFTRNGESTVSFSGQTTRIQMSTELVNAMSDFSNESAKVLEMFANQTPDGQDVSPFENSDLNISDKSIKSKVAASRDFFFTNTLESARIKSDFEQWIKLQFQEVGTAKNNLASAGIPGQVVDGSFVRYVNGDGLEYNQMVGKSLIGALMVDQMLNNYLSSSVLDEGDNIMQNNNELTLEGKPYTNMEHKWDEAYGYLFGVSEHPSDPIPMIGEDDFLNKYLARVDNDPDFFGIAQDIWDAFKLGRAAIVAGAYDVRDEQAEIIRNLVSKVIAIRAVYYLQQGKLSLSSSSTPGTAFHALSEGAGFIYSLRFLRSQSSNDSLFSREEVDGFLDKLFLGNGFWDLTPETLDEISEEIAGKFQFSIEQAAN